MRSTPAPTCSWQTSRTRPLRRGATSCRGSSIFEMPFGARSPTRIRRAESPTRLATTTRRCSCVAADYTLDMARGTIKATVLIETLPAVFQMHEILHALREHIVGLNCGRWDYIFSFIKTRSADPAAVLPDSS